MTDTVTARLITDDSDALRTAHALVPRLAAEADQRDAERRLPWPELAEIRASGLLGITGARFAGRRGSSGGNRGRSDAPGGNS